MKASLKHKNNEGFSLIELVVVVAVLAILAAIGIPSFNAIIKQALLAITKTSLIDNYKQCKMNSDGEINLSNIPGVVFQSNDCTSDITATINSECTLKMNMSTGAKTGWTNFYDQCVSGTNNSSGNGNGNGNGNGIYNKGIVYEGEFDEYPVTTCVSQGELEDFADWGVEGGEEWGWNEMGQAVITTKNASTVEEQAQICRDLQNGENPFK